MKYNEMIELTEHALDLLNIESFLEEDLELQTIIDNIKYAIDIKSENISQEFWDFLNSHEDFFRGDIFNWMTDDEFLNYCKYKYPKIRWHTEVIERHWITDKGV